DRGAAHTKMTRRVPVSAAVVCHGKVHNRIALYVARVNERLFVRLPYAVNDWRMSRITRRAMIEISAQIDDSHCMLLAGVLPALLKHYSRAGLGRRNPV